MNDPNCFRIFLSSTFRDLRDERQAVEYVIHRMGDHFVGMEHFGSSPHTPIDECLSQVRTADMVVLVVGYRHGSVPRKRKKSMVEREYWEARTMNVPILVYLADSESYPPDPNQNERIVEFRTFLSENHTLSYFKSKDDLASQVAADLAREIRRIDARFDKDTVGIIASKHEMVVDLIKAGDLLSAKALNEEIVREHRWSPRSHFNHACIFSRMAAVAPDHLQMVDRLVESRRRLCDALRYGFLEELTKFGGYSKSEFANAKERVIQDADLACLFAFWPSLADSVRNDNFGDLAVRSICG